MPTPDKNEQDINVNVDMSALTEALKSNKEAQQEFQALVQLQTKELAELRAQLETERAETAFRREVSSLDTYVDSGVITKEALAEIVGDYAAFTKRSHVDVLKSVLAAVTVKAATVKEVAKENFAAQPPVTPLVKDEKSSKAIAAFDSIIDRYSKGGV